MVRVELTKEIEERLEALARETGRSTEDCLRDAVMEYLEEQEDYLIAKSRLAKGRAGVALDEVERRLGLVD